MSRKRGGGSVYKQPGCRMWTIQFYRNGKRMRESTGFTDYRAAQQLLTQRLHHINTGEYIERPKKPALVAELFEGLIRHYRNNGRKSLDAVERRWKHLSAFFGDWPALNVTTDTIERYVDSRLSDGAAPATVNREVAALKTMFRIAARNGKVARVPVFPSQLKENNTRTGFVDDAQYARLTANASELWLRVFLEVAYTFGWRKSEILSLRVRQIDLGSRLIRLDVGSTKNGEGREVRMTERIYQLVRECIAGKGQDDFVLTRKHGRPVRDFRKAWRNLLTAADLDGRLIHDFRRSAARNLRRAGVPESVVMSIGGWKTAAMFRRYAIVSSADIAAGLEQLEQHRAKFSHDFSHDASSLVQAESESVNARIN